MLNAVTHDCKVSRCKRRVLDNPCRIGTAKMGKKNGQSGEQDPKGVFNETLLTWRSLTQISEAFLGDDLLLLI